MGCADRSAYDLSQHTLATKVRLVAEKKLAEPKTVDFVEAVPNKAAVGKSFKKEAKEIMETLSKLEPAEIEAVESALKSKGEYQLAINGTQYRLTPEMLEVKRGQKTVHVEEYVPNVIEPSFGIGRIMYSIFEHNFRVRSDDGQRTVSPLFSSYQFLDAIQTFFFIFGFVCSVLFTTSVDCSVEMLGTSAEQQCRVCSSHPQVG